MRPFFYVPDAGLMSPLARRNLDRFLAASRDELAGPLTFAGRIREMGRRYHRNWKQISNNWIVRNCREHVVAVTLETPWNTPHSRVEGYQTVGSQLGRAIERYFQRNPREPESFSGIYPHLAFFNDEQECGTGAVVPWAGRLWVVTYAAHAPRGSSDKLYEITPDLRQIARPESIGGTPANRMIHRESKQLFIGPYAIDAQRQVRVIPYTSMFGRLTANARHLTDPANKIYFATMEEGLYEVDVHTLKVSPIFFDEAAKGKEPKAHLPGHHGKGLYSSQGRLVYANNGERGERAKRDPFAPSGVLAERRAAGNWKVVLRSQFTEVTGPGGIFGNASPETDPIWAVGWDARSLLLMVLDDGRWHRYRLPKASHSYDGAHGWNTEWPRIRDIGEDDLLMTMHGMFWRFPRTFSAARSAGIRPRSTYLKVVGDFCRWQDRIVLGCDDTARSEFLNQRRAKGRIAPTQSQSNLWFLEPEQLDRLGPVVGQGAVWWNDRVEADAPSDPFLISGFNRRAVHLVSDRATTIRFEVDVEGNGQWKPLGEVPVNGYRWHSFDASLGAVWVRLRSSKPLEKATAWFHFAGASGRKTTDRYPAQTPEPVPMKFSGLAGPNDRGVVGGLIRPRGKNKRTLQLAAVDAEGKIGNYILDADMRLTADGDDKAWNWLQQNAAIPSREGILTVDAASVIYTDDAGRRYRLPKNAQFVEPGPLGFGRLCREVVTERDLFNCHGTFYELPADNAGGFRRVRPIATHNRRIFDYCSYRGLLVISGIRLAAAGNNRHIIRSGDGKAALWVGAIDDLWELGKPVGDGGPWFNSRVRAGEFSDPYLMNGYDRKSLELETADAAAVTVQVDLSGMGDWQTYKTFALSAGQRMKIEFPRAFQAYWIRFRSDRSTTATAQLHYR